MTNQLASSAGKVEGGFLANDEAINSFSLHLRAGGRRATTEATYLRCLHYLAAFCQARGMPPVSELTAEYLREYFSSMYGRGLEHTTVSIHSRSLQQFYKFLIMEGERKDNPLQRISPPRVEEKIQAHYGRAEMEAVLKRLPAVSKDWRILRNRAIVLALYDTGLRGAELCGLKRDDVNLRGLSMLVKKPKGDRWREVSVSPLTAQAVDRYLRHRNDLSPWLFVARDGGALTTNGLRMMLERVWKDAGMDFRGVHGFRRGFAISFLDNGGDPEDLRRLAGWDSPQMLRRYTRATETEGARKAHTRYSPVSALGLPR